MRKAIAIALAVMAAVAVAEVRFWLPCNENLREAAATPLHRTTSQVAMARAGENVPHEYLEYLNLGSGQWFDTGWIPTINPDNVECELRSNYKPTTFVGYFGVRQGPIFFCRQSDFWIQFWALENKNAPSTDVLSWGFFKIGIDPETMVPYVRSNQLPAITTTATFTIPMYVGAINYNGTVDAATSDIDLKYFICRSGTTVVHDFRPVRRKSDGKCCFYDEIDKTYHLNGGTGEFTPPNE